MKAPLLALVLGLTVITSLGQISSISAATCTSNTQAQTFYYDCTTGIYCGETDYFCFSRPTYSHTGCTTACYENTGRCTCPDPRDFSTAASRPASGSALTSPAMCLKTGGKAQRGI
jgi:hypothetical protein